MLRFIYYTALILGLYFIFKFILKLLLYIFVASSKRKFEKFYGNKNVGKNSEEETVTYKVKNEDAEIIEFEEE